MISQIDIFEAIAFKSGRQIQEPADDQLVERQESSLNKLTRPCHDVASSLHECNRGELPLQALWQLDRLERCDSWYYLLLPIAANHQVLEGKTIQQ